MQMDQLLDDARHWYARAEQTLAIVSHIQSDPEARAILQKIAAQYERGRAMRYVTTIWEPHRRTQFNPEIPSREFRHSVAFCHGPQPPSAGS